MSVGGDVYPGEALIDGELTPAADGKTLNSLNPATGTVLAPFSDCSEVDVDRAVSSARAAFESGSWSRRSPAERKAGLLRFAELIESESDNLAKLDTMDAGKPIADTTENDLPETVQILRWYAELADKEFGKVSPTGLDALALTVKEPVGVVAAVLPWNFPTLIVAQKVGPALAAGNSIIVKPPEQAPLSTVRLGKLAVEAGIPEGVFNVVPGRGEVTGRALGMHPDVDAVSFTGSTTVGRRFLQFSSESNLKRVVMELGGKSPQIVMADAISDAQSVARHLATAAYWNGGQNCTCGSRVFIDAAVRDEVLERFVEATGTWKVGDPSDPTTRIGPMIEAKALDRILGYIEAARDDGATVVTGGQRMLEETGGWFVQPTILADVNNDMSVAREEIFGPVVSVMTFETEDEAIRLANDTTYGLAASVYTKDIDQAFRLARAVRAGTVAVNCFSEGDISTPFGGYRQSGFGGRDFGTEAIDQYTELKAIWCELTP